MTSLLQLNYLIFRSFLPLLLLTLTTLSPAGSILKISTRRKENIGPIDRARFESKEVEIAKAFLLNAISGRNDSSFERQTKDLVSNFLVNAAVNEQGAEIVEDYDDGYYTDISTTTTTQAPFIWPLLTGSSSADLDQTSLQQSLIQFSNLSTEGSGSQSGHTMPSPDFTDFYDIPEEITVNPSFGFALENSTPLQTADPTIASNVTLDLDIEMGAENENSTTTVNGTIEGDVNGTESDDGSTKKPGRKPGGGLIGAVQHITLIVPDVIKPGNNKSILNGKNVGNILKILGSVAFLNLSGIIDNSIELGTSTAVREIVFGVTNIVFCNSFIKSLNGGRCNRQLSYPGEEDFADLRS